MSRLIKRHASVAAALPVEPSVTVDAMAAAQARIATLEAQLQALQTQHEGALCEAVEAALARGHETGIAAAQATAQAQATEEQARLTALTVALDAAHDAFSKRLDTAAEALALTLALAALERVLGAPDAYRDLVTATITHRLQGLREGAVVRLRVAAVDFAEAGLPAIPGAVVEVCAALPAGSCVLDLATGGELDLSVPGQHQRLATQLQALTDG